MNKLLYQGHIARKRFGQNFLADPFVIEEIVTAIAPEKEQALVEIGPGLAALTMPIAQQVDHLTVIEIDRDLAARLANNSKLKGKMTIIEQDAMKVDFGKLANEAGQPLRIFGNLPYNISTPLMFYLFKFTTAIADMHFTLQKEVVSRLIATPNHKAYGRLSVMAQYYCKIMSVLDIPPSAFRPAPKVDSAVVRLTPYLSPPSPVREIAILRQITTRAFNQRRKTIHNSLGQLFTDTQFSQLGIDTTARAENLSVAQYVDLANLYYFENQHKQDS